MTRHWLSRALLVCRSCVKVGSSICHSCIARASAQVVVVGPSLLYRCSVYWTRGQSSARPARIRVAASSLVHLFGSGSLVCILDLWSVACSSVVGVSLVCRWCVTDLSARLLLVHLFVCLWFVTVLYQFVVTGPSLIHLFVHRSCVCSSITGPSVRSSLVCRWSVCWSCGHWCVVRASLVRLLESSLRCHSAPLGTVSLLFDCSTRRPARIPILSVG